MLLSGSIGGVVPCLCLCSNFVFRKQGVQGENFSNLILVFELYFKALKLVWKCVYGMLEIVIFIYKVDWPEHANQQK